MSITQKDIMNTLNICYDKCINGIPKITPKIEDTVNEYMGKHRTKYGAAKHLIRNALIKCTVSGVLTGFGGAITLPVSIPANIASILYVQVRMITCLAAIGGYDINCDETQTFVYACLAGVSINQFVKKAGTQMAFKIGTNAVKKVPGKALQKINQKVGFRLLTKFGKTGIVNLGKMVPAVGALVSGGLDLTETKIIADRAYRWFICSDFNK